MIKSIIRMFVDRFLKAALRQKGQVRSEAMEDKEAKKQEEEEEQQKTLILYLFYRI